ncbi:tetratricopeptide repeat protein [Kribbella sp. VKM Ac-2569]|uniref:tetratricopeptide repeat protein n=1 Tax=Kribbella sp. VKM Ac-2569 TaxID=2512220 RepID=UPI00102C1B75|nr:tetratricopeptide repeat protein [Kribbella sp. VKM Ac-2569]
MLPDDGGLLLDPTRDETLDAIDDAFTISAQDGATLVLAMIGHGIALGDDFYFLSADATGEGNSRKDVHLSQALKEGLRDHGDLDGLIVLVDTCQAGVVAGQALRHWGEVGMGRYARRFELLTATAETPAYGGDFTRILVDVLRSGVPSAGTTIDARYLRDPLMTGAPAQNPQRITVDGGSWAQSGDEGLWLAYNAVVRHEDDDAAARTTIDRVVELTNFLQTTPTMVALEEATTQHRCVVLTGPRGSGKSTLAAAFIRPSAAHGRMSSGTIHAVAFGNGASTLGTLAASLAGQLTDQLPGFQQAARAYASSLDAAEIEGLPSLQRRVLGPLSRVGSMQQVRLIIDALDELPGATQDAVRDSITTALRQPALDLVGFVVTARPSAARPPGAHHVEADQPGDDIIAEYLRARRVDETYVSLLVPRAQGSWLHAHLLAEHAVRPGFDAADIPTEPQLTALYDEELLAAGAGNIDRWQSELRPVLAVLAAAGAGPNLPLPLAVAATARLDGPATTIRFRDVIARLSGLIVRSQPGQIGEQIGLFHSSLIEDYLLRPAQEAQFSIDPAPAHAALAAALGELASPTDHDPTDALHRYASRAEADHLWASHRDSTAVLASLNQRPLNQAADEKERWQQWHTTFESVLGPEHPDTLSAQASLAHWTGRAGDPTRARGQFTELVPILQRVAGPERAETLSARGELANWTGQAGDPAAARNQLASLVRILERVSGPEHPETLTARTNLAIWTGEAGEPAAARSQLARLVRTLERVSGLEHPDTLAARFDLAVWTGQAGDPAKSRNQLAELVPIMVGTLGAEHPDTLSTRTTLAFYIGRAGDPAAARDQFAELVPIRERISGQEHPDTLTARANLATSIGEAGDPALARDHYTDLVRIRERVSGPEHPSTLLCRASLAGWTGRAGDPVTARDMYFELVPIRERISGPHHPSTIRAQTNLAYWILATARREQ